MKIKEVSFENFKSFRGKHKLDLDNDKGIFFLTGQNEADLAIGANGAGKSTLFDAIYWCFYGKTLRGLHASNIRSWGHLGSTRATVSFEGKGTEHVITRSWNPNLLEISGTTVKQEDVDKLIGLNAEAFKHAVIMGQTNPMFFDLKPTDKLGLVSDVLDLSKWVALSEKTKNKAVAFQKELDKLERTISFSKGKLAGLYDNLETTTHSAEAWEESNNAIVGEIRAGIVIQELNIDNKQQQVQDLGKRLEETTNLKASIIESMQDTLDVMHEFQRVGTDLTMEKREIEINCEHCKVSLESFDRLDKEGKCYICEQEVDSTHINKHKEELQDKTSKFGLDIARLQEQIEKADQSASELVKRRDEMNEDLDLVRQELKADEINFRLGTESLERHRLELAQLLKERGIQINQENDHLKSIDRISEQIKYAENSLEKFKVEQTKLTNQFDSAKFWQKSFKEIRLFVIDQAVESLEIEINSSLHQLGLHDWSIHLEMEKENKSGGVSKGFHVNIMSPSNTEKVPWEAWSGGESQRLKIAGTMGMSNLILNQAGVQCNLEVWDEPSQFLSKEGIDDLLDTLHQRALSTGKQIWLIDHRSLNYGNFAATYNVIKDENGSRIG